jgi:hypothetical protein
MEDPMGFERHTVTTADAGVKTTPDLKVLREAAPILTPLRQADATCDPDIMRTARQMRGEWRKERYSRLAK